MNLKIDLERNRKIIHLNLISLLAIFIVLSTVGYFYSVPLGIVFTVVSIFYLLFITIVTKTLKKKINEKVSK